jgi:glycosyltransferase involved in cell wall biosynthesis
MKYSFILLAYNEAGNIAACIQSIERQEQMDHDYEIVVVDDGSKDATADIVRGMGANNHRLRLVGDGKNHGRGFGRWRGVQEAAGDFIIMADADIILPSNWLATTLPYLKNYDMSGGIAVPDGDVAYVYRRFHLRPKTIMGSTTITGNNGIYKRAVFEKVTFDPALREGEDVDFNHRAAAAGFKAISIPGLTVEHQEEKTFKRSMAWLFESGVGATRQLVRFHEIRQPDIAFAATILALLLAIVLSLAYGWWWAFLLPIFGVIGAAYLHINGKFYLSKKWARQSLGAVATDSLLLICYYVGRVIGIGILAKNFVLGGQASSPPPGARQHPA